MSIVAIDLGGSGSRAELRSGPGTGSALVSTSGPRLSSGRDGSSGPELAVALLRELAARHGLAAAEVTGIGVGASGLGTLVADPAGAAAAVRAEARGLGMRDAEVLIATDAVTAHLGALGGRAGAIIAAGTGAIGFGTDFSRVWRRVDGWGHLIGDRGSGAWIGREALALAVRAHDRVGQQDRPGPVGSAGAAEADEFGASLLRAATRRFGAVETWPGQLYTRDDRAGVLAGFVPDLAALARAGDRAAVTLFERAGRALADTLAAALGSELPARVAATGGLFGAGVLIERPLREHLAELRPDAEWRPSLGDPLEGAARLAQRAAEREPAHPPHVWSGQA